MAFTYGSHYHFTSATPITTYPFTMACWFYPTDTGNNFQTIISLANGSSAVDYFSMTLMFAVGGDPLRLNTRSTAEGDSNVDVASLAGNVWQSGVAVFTNSTTKVVYLGTSVSGNLATDVTPSSISRIGIASTVDSSPDVAYSGAVAEVAFWNIALTAEQVGSYASGMSARLIAPSALKFYAPNIREAKDIVGGYSITDAGTGSPTVSAHPRMIYPTAQILPFPSSGAEALVNDRISSMHFLKMWQPTALAE